MSLQELYLRAKGTSRLRLTTTHQTAADILTAAGWVSQGHPRRAMALRLYAVLATEDMRGAHAVAEDLSKMVRKRSSIQQKFAIPQTEAVDMCLMVLKWWKRPACLTCGGHGHPTIAGSPVLDDSRECHVCHGTGLIPLDKLIKHKHLVYAEWLISQMDGMTASVFDAVGRRLREGDGG